MVVSDGKECFVDLVRTLIVDKGELGGEMLW